MDKTIVISCSHGTSLSVVDDSVQKTLFFLSVKKRSFSGNVSYSSVQLILSSLLLLKILKSKLYEVTC